MDKWEGDFISHDPFRKRHSEDVYKRQNMLRLLLAMEFITEEEYQKIVQISAGHYGAEKIYV